MDGLSILFGILTFAFLAVMLGMNFFNNQSTQKAESFVDLKTMFQNAKDAMNPMSKESPNPPQSEIQKSIRKTLDQLVLNTSPDGTPTSDGSDLCGIFDNLRKSMAVSEKAKQVPIDTILAPGTTKLDLKSQLSDAEVVRRVELNMAYEIPGGPLNCPLIQYPSAAQSDAEWVKWLQGLPRDLGARVIFMAVYADEKLASMYSNVQNTINTPVDATESFIATTTPQLTSVSQKNSQSTSNTNPATMTPAELSDTVKSILDDMVAVKNSKITNAYNPRSSGATINAHEHIVRAKETIEKLKKLSDSVADGTTQVRTFENSDKEDSAANAAKEQAYRDNAQLESLMKDAPITDYIRSNNPFP
jgi:hypothetical protein